MKNSTDDELALVLQIWIDSVYKQIQNNIGEFSDPIGGISMWHKDDLGSYIRVLYQIFYNSRKLDELINGMKEWSEVTRVALAHVNFAKHVDQLVGSTSGSMRAFSVGELCKTILPAIQTDGKKIFFDPEYRTNQAVVSLLSAINNENITTTIVWPISGVGTDLEIALDAETFFRKLTDREKLLCLGLDIIRPFGHQNVIDGANSNWYGLIRTETVKKRLVIEAICHKIS